MKRSGTMAIIMMFVAAFCLISLASASNSFGAESELQRILKRGSFRVGAPSSIPWSMKDLQTGKWTGVFIEVFELMAEDLGVKLEIVETTWGNAIAGLQADQFDVIGGLNARPKRALAVDFSRPFFKGAVGILVRKDVGKYKDWKHWKDIDKKEVTIAANAGAASTSTIQMLAPNATLRLVPSKDMMWMELESGRVDAVGSSWGSIVAYTKEKGGTGKLLLPITGNVTNIGMRKTENKELRDWINVALDHYEAQGKIRQICDKYIPGAYFLVKWE